jgi:hypothetical protein
MPMNLGNVTPSRVVGAVVSRANYWFVHPVVGAVPRMVFGNDAGIRGNIRGELDRRRGQRAYEAATGTPAPSSPESERLRAQGFLPLEPDYPEGAVERVRDSYRRLIATDEGSRFNGVGKFLKTSRAIIDAAHNLDGVEALITPRVQSIVEGYYGSWFEVHQVEAWRTVTIPGLVDDTSVEAYSNQWHNDRYPTSWLRVFCYLSDGVTKETGAFRCHPIPSTKEIIRSGGYLRRSLITAKVRAQLEDESRIVYFEGDAGAACLANAMHCLHRAGIPRPGYERDMLAFTFRPSARRLAPGWSGEVAVES